MTQQRCLFCGSTNGPNFDGQCDNCGGRLFARAKTNAKGDAVEAVDDLWAGLRGSDDQSRVRRLTEFLGGFNAAYLETRCTPAGDLAAILAMRAAHVTAPVSHD